ncbi:MAG: glutamine amidotransferase [Cyanobacteria bacterium P01_C01_bin.70]
MSPAHRILAIVHQATSNPGLVGDKLRLRGYQLDIRCPAIGDTLPHNLSNYAGAIVFGGPMSANDDTALSFIRTELEWISMALATDCPYLGICLGAQLLARVLGAAVSPRPDGQREIGYCNLQPTSTGAPYFTTPMAIYQWHGEGFALPTGTIHLATGDIFPNQAFRYGDRVFGLQFHPEMTTYLIDEWTTRGVEQLNLPGAQPRDRHFAAHQQYGHQVDRWLEDFLTHWLGEESWKASKSA